MSHFYQKVELAPNILFTAALNVCEKEEKYLVQKGNRSISIKYLRLHYSHSHCQVKSIKWTQFPDSFDPTKNSKRRAFNQIKMSPNTVISTLG